MNRSGTHFVTNRRGFLIVEALVSVALFSTIMLVYLYNNSVTSLATGNQRNRVMASIMLDNVLEDLSMRMSNDTDLLASYNSFHIRYFDKSLRETTLANSVYQIRWLVSENTPFTGNKQISVTISWADGTSKRSLNSKMVR